MVVGVDPSPFRRADRTSADTTVIGPHTARVAEREIGGCIALLHPESDEALVLNETATDVWHLSDGTMDLDGIVQALANSYRVDPEIIHGDVERTVRSLFDHGFITISNP